MLGHLRMNIATATDALMEIANAIHPNAAAGNSTPQQNTHRLRNAIESMLDHLAIPRDVTMVDARLPPGRCKVFVL